MTEHELLRFTANKLSAKQIAHLFAIVGDWHAVHVAVVGDGQVGVVGPDQRHDILRQAVTKDANGQYL